MEIVPVTLEEANRYIERFHRHTGPMPFASARFACAAIDECGHVLGVVIAGHTSARMLMCRTTLEINRVCSDGAPNVCSKLYAAVLRAGKALGYRRFITYTLTTESGCSLRASGWHQVATVGQRSWSRERHDQVIADGYQHGDRVRWEIRLPEAPTTCWPPLLPSPQLTLDLDPILL